MKVGGEGGIKHMAAKMTWDEDHNRKANYIADQIVLIHDFTTLTAAADPEENTGSCGGVVEPNGLGWFIYMF